MFITFERPAGKDNGRGTQFLDNGRPFELLSSPKKIPVVDRKVFGQPVEVYWRISAETMVTEARTNLAGSRYSRLSTAYCVYFAKATYVLDGLEKVARR